VTTAAPHRETRRPPVYLPAFSTRWTDKVEEPFYEELL
jgi:hypothetical protein